MGDSERALWADAVCQDFDLMRADGLNKGAWGRCDRYGFDKR